MYKNLKTGNIIFYCKKWEKTVQFYKDRLNLPVNFSADWFIEFSLTATSRLSIADDRRASVKSGGGKGVTLALEVDDIETVREYMENVGLKPTVIWKHPWDANVFHLFDPEGHRIEIWQSSVNQNSFNNNNNIKESKNG